MFDRSFGREMNLLKNFNKKNPEIIKTYKKYRKLGVQLNDKVMKACLEPEATKGSAELLGVLQGNTLTLEAEEEGAALMDFLLHDYRIGGQTAVERYQAQAQDLSSEEKDLFAAWLVSYTSLFEVAEVRKAEDSLILKDLLNDRQDIHLVDVSFSKSSSPGLLMFLRLVPLKGFNMTSGNIFAFSEDSKKYLIKQQKTLAKKVKSSDEAIQRFVAFFKLNRAIGIEVRYR